MIGQYNVITIQCLRQMMFCSMVSDLIDLLRFEMKKVLVNFVGILKNVIETQSTFNSIEMHSPSSLLLLFSKYSVVKKFVLFGWREKL